MGGWVRSPAAHVQQRCRCTCEPPTNRCAAGRTEREPPDPVDWLPRRAAAKHDPRDAYWLLILAVVSGKDDGSMIRDIGPSTLPGASERAPSWLSGRDL